MANHFEFPEGATPISDCSELIPTWVQNLNDLNRVEAENISQAQRKYLKSPVGDATLWFKIKTLRAIHQSMFGNVWDWAGVFRKNVTSIGVKPSLIPSHLADLCIEVISWSHQPIELSFLEKAARIHHRLVAIHPFENGNGRFSRLIADRYLMSYRCPHAIWPNQLNDQNSMRMEYIEALREADRGSYDSLIIFMEKFGAREPRLEELLENKFYLSRLKQDVIVTASKAVLRRSSNAHVVEIF